MSSGSSSASTKLRRRRAPKRATRRRRGRGRGRRRYGGSPAAVDAAITAETDDAAVAAIRSAFNEEDEQQAAARAAIEELAGRGYLGAGMEHTIGSIYRVDALAEAFNMRPRTCRAAREPPWPRPAQWCRPANPLDAGGKQSSARADRGSRRRRRRSPSFASAIR